MAEKSQTEVHLNRDGHVATIQFIPTTGVNIFSTRVITALGETIAQIAKDEQIRFVVFRGHGKIFLAGADISEMSDFDDAAARAFGSRGHEVFDAIEALPQVTIAAINGHAMGGGCELAMTCDFRLMVATGKIGQPETRLGLIPGWGGTQRITKYVPLGWARRLLFSGDSIPAEQANQIGLVDEVVASADELDATLDKWFKYLAPGSPKAIANVKASLRTGDEVGEFARCFTTGDGPVGTKAFIEKQQPPWANM